MANNNHTYRPLKPGDRVHYTGDEQVANGFATILGSRKERFKGHEYLVRFNKKDPNRWINSCPVCGRLLQCSFHLEAEIENAKKDYALTVNQRLRSSGHA